jgi:hypothetical protein
MLASGSLLLLTQPNTPGDHTSCAAEMIFAVPSQCSVLLLSASMGASARAPVEDSGAAA